MFGLMVALVAAGNERMVVRFAHDADMRAARPVLEEKAELVKTVSGLINFAVVLTDDPSWLEELPGVLYVEKDQKVQALYTPDDPIWGKQWGPANINCPLAWDITLGDTAVKVGVLDEGIDYTHPDLAPYFGPNPGWDFVDNDPDPAPDWGLYHEIHGQHVTGILAAVTGNGQYMAGVAQCHLYALRVLDSMGVGYTSNIAEAVLWAADSGLDVINMSLGSYGPSSILKDACDAAYAAGVLIVAATGNDGRGDIMYPAAYSSVIAVGATALGDTLWQNSNYGAEQELVAPGVDIVSIMPYGNVFYGETLSASGTSMASPHVAGVAALVKAAFPSMTNEEIRTRLQETAEDLGEPGWDTLYGYGKVDAYGAVYVREAPARVADLSINGPSVLSGPGVFKLPPGAEIQLFSATGRLLLRASPQGERFLLDPNNFLDGAYFLLASKDGRTVLKKIVIRR